MKIDFANVREPEPVEAGNYEATFTGHKMGEGRDSKKPYVRMEYTISDGEYAGRKVFRVQSLQEQSLWMLKQTMLTLGADPDLFDGEMDLEEALTDLYGSACLIEVSIQEARDENDRPRPQVNRVRDLSFA